MLYATAVFSSYFWLIMDTYRCYIFLNLCVEVLFIYGAAASIALYRKEYGIVIFYYYLLYRTCFRSSQVHLDCVQCATFDHIVNMGLVGNSLLYLRYAAVFVSAYNQFIININHLNI